MPSMICGRVRLYNVEDSSKNSKKWFRTSSPFGSTKLAAKRVSARLPLSFKILMVLKNFRLERISEYFFFVHDLTVCFMEVPFSPGTEKSVRFNQVSAL